MWLVYFKLEENNPGEVLKIGLLINMIKSALRRGEIDSTSKLIEATSGKITALRSMMLDISTRLELFIAASAELRSVFKRWGYGAKSLLPPRMYKRAVNYATAKSGKWRVLPLINFQWGSLESHHTKNTDPKNYGKITHGESDALRFFHGNYCERLWNFELFKRKEPTTFK